MQRRNDAKNGRCPRASRRHPRLFARQLAHGGVASVTLSEIVNQIQSPYNSAAVSSNGLRDHAGDNHAQMIHAKIRHFMFAYCWLIGLTAFIAVSVRFLISP